jgi:hypothetical protein
MSRGQGIVRRRIGVELSAPGTLFFNARELAALAFPRRTSPPPTKKTRAAERYGRRRDARANASATGSFRSRRRPGIASRNGHPMQMLAEHVGRNGRTAALN